MRITLAAFAVVIASALLPVETFAHHPFAPDFDWTKPLTLTGTVTKVEWTNPHAVVYMDARNATGAVVNWALELGSPRVLTKYYGWSGNVPKAGDKVTVKGWLARNGQNFVSAKSFTLSDGRELFAASSFFDLPGRCVSDEVCIGDEDSE